MPVYSGDAIALYASLYSQLLSSEGWSEKEMENIVALERDEDRMKSVFSVDWDLVGGCGLCLR